MCAYLYAIYANTYISAPLFPQYESDTDFRNKNRYCTEYL